MKNTLSHFVIICLFCFSNAIAQENYDIKEISNLQYYQTESPEESLTKLNLILPEGVENPPVFIWIGGGAWAYVNKDNEMKICRKLAQQGIAVVSVQHRLSPALLTAQKREEGVQHPEHAKDVAHAFKWVYDHASTYGYNQNSISIGGFSSGAHLSTMLTVDTRFLESVGLSQQHITATIPVGGGYDMVEYKNMLAEADPSYVENHINPVFGKTEQEQIDASPITYIDNLTTPMLVIAEGDTYPYHKSFEAIVIEKGIQNIEFLYLLNNTHAGLWNELGSDEPNMYRNLMVDYIKKWSHSTENTKE